MRQQQQHHQQQQWGKKSGETIEEGLGKWPACCRSSGAGGGVAT